jgi:signal transduction histidine kinase
MKLQYKVTLFIFLLLLVIGVVGAMAMLQLQRQSAISQFEESALTLAQTLSDSLQHDMLDANSRARIQDAVQRIAAGNNINEVVIFSNTQNIYASGESSEIGETRTDREIARALSSGETITRTEEQYGESELCVIIPIETQPECISCHGSQAKILGAIEIGLDVEPLNEQIKEQTLIMALIGGLTFAAIGGALALMFKSEVVNPLSQLAASARRIAQGDFSARAELDRKDEVGMVAHTFNEMAEQVEQQTRALEDSKRDLEQRVQERTEQVQQMAAVRGQLLERLISAQEEERKRVARELHDEAGQALSMIMLDLARTRDSLPSDAKEARQRLSQSRSLAEQTLADLRRMIYELRPEVLDQLGLVPALRSYVKSRLEAENMKVQLHFPQLNDRLAPLVEITLFRVIQEATTNISRHSGASVVNIEVVMKDSTVIATIEDNGKGFDVEAAFKAPESWGLRGIRERVAVIGGELNIESQIEHGTRLQVRLPLDV